MDQNIHSHTHVMGEKWIFLLIMNIDNSDKLCRHLVEMENRVLHLGLHHFNPPSQWQAWEEQQCVLKWTKGCKLKHV